MKINTSSPSGFPEHRERCFSSPVLSQETCNQCSRGFKKWVWQAGWPRRGELQHFRSFSFYFNRLPESSRAIYTTQSIN